MSGDSVKLAPDARARVDTYLDAIEKALQRAGRPRDERRGVADDVEAQILEMLADRAGFAPSLADVEAVLSDLDSPEAYAEAEGAPSDGVPAGGEGAPKAAAARPAQPAAPKGPRLSRAAIVGACWAPLAIFLLPALAVVLYHGMAAPAPPEPAVLAPSVEQVPPQEAPDAPAPDTPEPPESSETRELSTAERIQREAERDVAREVAAMEAEARAHVVEMRSTRFSWFAVILLAPLALIGLSAPFGTTILGLVAISHIRHSAGRLYGMGLAVFDAVLFPLLLLDALLVFVGVTWANLGMPEGLILGLIADVAVVVLVWRRVQPRAEGQGGPESPQATRSRRRLGVLSLVLAVAGVVVGTGAAAIGQVAGLPSAGMAGYLAFLGLEVAALVCGIVAWSATPVAKVGTIVSGVLMAGSVLMLA